MKALCCKGFTGTRQAAQRPAPAALRLLAAALLLIAPTLGTVVGSSTAADAAPAPQVRAAASFSDGRCTSGDTSSVTVVIDFQGLGGGTTVRCAHGLSAGARGTAALAAAGIGYTGTARWGAAFVCRIQGRPSPTEVLPLSSGGYRERCTDTPPAKAYWSYWQADEGGAWAYSQLGVQSQKVRLGGFEGWSFSMNASSDTNPAPGVDTSLIAPAPPPTTAQPTTSRPAPPTTAPRPTTARPPAPPVTSRATPPRPTTRPTAQRPTPQRPTPQRPTTPQPTTPQPDPGTSTAVTPIAPAAPTVDPGAPNTEAPVAGATTAGATAAGTSGAQTTGGAVPSSSTSVADPSGSAPPAGGSTGPAPSLPPASQPGTSGSGAPGSGTRPSSRKAEARTAGSVVPADSATDPDLTAGQVEPGSSSAWPVIGVLALALIAGGAAVLVARRRRDNGV